MADLNRPANELPPDAPSSLEDWRRLVEASLKGAEFSTLQSRTRDGIPIEPLYTPRADAQILSGRGPRRWIVVQLVDDPDPERANAQALDDLRGGAGGLVVRFARAASPRAAGLPAREEALRLALDGVDLAAIHLRIEPHPRASEAADWVQELVGRQGVAPELTDIAWGLDPVALSSQGSGVDPVAVADILVGLMDAGFTGALAEIDGRVVHEAGGSEAQELAAALAGAAWWLRALDGAGVGPATALPCFGASLALDHDQFLSIAKLRAMRMLWARLLEVCEGRPSPLRIHAETSRRMMTRSDPHTNLLRTTIAAFAAGVGGADSVTVIPFDAARTASGRSSRALARNIQHLLLEESQLHRVADPSAGSGLIEALTENLAESAWAEFQAIEGEGGMVESLRTGAFPARIAHSRKELQAKLVSGAVPLVGATIYRDAGQPPGTGAQETALDDPAGLAPIDLETLAQAAA